MPSNIVKDMGQVKSNPFSRLLPLLVAGLLAMLVVLLPAVQSLETETGLTWLFKQRGPLSLPGDEALVIAMDSYSAQRLQLKLDTSTWPRNLHAELLTKLSKAGARVVSFDIFFRESREQAADQQLIDAVNQAPAVSLYQMIEQQLAVHTQRDGALASASLLDPFPGLADSQAAVAPFPLPAVPQQVNSFWLFHDALGGIATLPVMVLHQYLLTGETGLFTGNDLPVQVRQAHEQWQKSGQLSVPLEAALQRLERGHRQALQAVYRGAAHRLFNFYGPARSVTTISYADFFTPEQPELEAQRLAQVRDKVVFVGLSEPLQWHQKDVFHTAFTDPVSGVNIPGVELLATAFLNLLHQDELQTVSPWLALLINMLLAMLVMLVAVNWPALRAMVLFAVLLVGYAWLASQQFAGGLVLPVIAPLIVMPLCLIIGMSWHFARLQQEKKRIRELFGFYLPDSEISRLARLQSAPGHHSRVVEGIVMSTDAENYTSLAEQLEPQALASEVNRYYEAVFAPIRKYRGHVSDVVGDAVMVIWADAGGADVRGAAACDAAGQAALEIQALEVPVALPGGEVNLRTRIGLHWGEMAMSNVGALDHYEYRAVGDIVNTASRIEGVNKQLGTYALASEALVRQLRTVDSRYLGQFQLVGKQQAIGLYELLQPAVTQTAGQPEVQTGRHQQFAAAMALLADGDLAGALQSFQRLAKTDPVARFYRDYLSGLQQSGQLAAWNGVVVLAKK